MPRKGAPNSRAPQEETGPCPGAHVRRLISSPTMTSQKWGQDEEAGQLHSSLHPFCTVWPLESIPWGLGRAGPAFPSLLGITWSGCTRAAVRRRARGAGRGRTAQGPMTRCLSSPSRRRSLSGSSPREQPGAQTAWGSGKRSEHSCDPSPGHAPHPGGVQSLLCELSLEEMSHLFSQVRAWFLGALRKKQGGAVPLESHSHPATQRVERPAWVGTKAPFL